MSVPCLTNSGYAVQYAIARQLIATITAAAALFLSVGLLGVVSAARQAPIRSAIETDAPFVAEPHLQKPITSDLRIALQGPSVAAPGGRAIWRMTISNRAAATATAVLVTNTLPISVDLESSAPGGLQVSPGVISWSLGDLPGPMTHTLLVTGRIAAGLLAGGFITNSVEVSTVAPDRAIEDDSASVSAQLAVHDLRPDIAASASSAQPAERITYTVSLDNVSTVHADDVSLSITLGAGLRYVTDTASSAGFARSGSFGDGGVLRFERERLGGPTSIGFQLIARVQPDLEPGDEVTTTVQVSALSLDVVVGEKAHAAEPVAIVIPDLRLAVRGGETSALGSLTRYRTYWSNDVGADARRVIMTSTLPAAVRFVTSTPPADLVDGTSDGPARLRWVLGPAAENSGEMAGPEITITHDVGFSAGESFTTTFEILEGVRDNDRSDNVVRRNTTLFSPLAATVTISGPMILAVGTEVGLSAVARNSRGEPIADGTEVMFQATAGALSDSAPLTRQGEATTTYRAPTIVGPVVIAANADGITATKGITIVPGAPATVTVASAPISATVGSTVTLNVDVIDGFANPVADGTFVRADAGVGRLTPSITGTLGGRARFEWYVEDAAPTTIAFMAGAAEAEVSGASIVDWAPDVPAQIVLMVEPDEVGAVGELVAASASVFDRWGNPVADGLTVRFSADGGSFVRAEETTRGGIATATWTSGVEIGEIGLTATVVRAGDDPPLENQVVITVEPADLQIDALVSGPRGALGDSVQIHPGEQLSMSLGVVNAGRATARGVIVSARLPEPLLDVTATTAAGAPLGPPDDPPASVGADAWSVPDLAAGEAITVTIRGTLDRAYTWTGAGPFLCARRGDIDHTRGKRIRFDPDRAGSRVVF